VVTDEQAVIQEQRANATCEGGMFGGNFLSAAGWRCPGYGSHSGFSFLRWFYGILEMAEEQLGRRGSMPLMRAQRTIPFFLAALALLSPVCPRSRAQAALLMEEPFGFFGLLNPTGHDAVYFWRICAETPVKLRRCAPGELGAVITRYQGIGDYDWVAMPLLPYLYAVESASEVPTRADQETVTGLRDKFHEAHLLSLGKDLPRGGDVQRGWSQFVGVAYERRIYAFRFATAEGQDDALIARMNAGANRSRFNLLYSNCADFNSGILKFYFPRTFRRSILPDAGITTPRQVTYKLLRYARKHPETQLAAFEIPQVPGYRRRSRSNKSIAESLITSGYVVPLALISPYIAGGVFVDYLVWGRYPLALKHPQILTPDNMAPLTFPAGSEQSPHSASALVDAPL
jgi:hypothetical protein